MAISREETSLRRIEMMDLIGIPLTSVILFVLAGILIGHSFWYYDRSADLEKISWLEKRYFQARHVARHRRLEQRALRTSKDHQQYELGTLQRRYELKLVEFKQMERSSTATTEALNSLRSEHHDVAEQLVNEQRRNELLVSQLKEVLQAKTRLESELAGRNPSLAQSAESPEDESPENAEPQNAASNQNQDTALRTTIDELRDKLDQSRDALNRTNRDLEARSNELDVMRIQRDVLKKDLSTSHQHAGQLAKALSTQEIRLSGVQEQLEELLPLRSESAEASLIIAQQRLQLAQRQKDNPQQKYDPQSKDVAPERASEDGEQNRNRAA